jgi:hypothetical protein
MTGRIGEAMMGCMRRFTHDDTGYLSWLAQHPEGFVINTYIKPSLRI